MPQKKKDKATVMPKKVVAENIAKEVAQHVQDTTGYHTLPDALMSIIIKHL